MTTTSPTAAQLKEEGNALYAASSWALARDKYSTAIALDGDNSILWANRAASEFYLKDFEMMEEDAWTATRLDPRYAKAWARLAAAQLGLGSVEDSIDSWRRAQSLLPIMKQRTPAQKRDAAWFEQGLDEAQSGLLHQVGCMPWDVASPLIQDSAYKASSAWPIAGAHAFWEHGMSLFPHIQKSPYQVQVFSGPLGAVEFLSNALTMDPRVYSVVKSPTAWLAEYNVQEQEKQMRGAFADSLSATDIMEAMPGQVLRAGWNVVRPAFSVTVRDRLVRGFAICVQGRPMEGEPLIGDAVRLLEWAAEKYADISDAERGAAMKSTFLRGAKEMRLGAYSQALIARTRDASTSSDRRQDGPEYTLSGLRALANELEFDTAAHPAPSLDTADLQPNERLSFFVNPRACALATLALCHRHAGRAAQASARAQSWPDRRSHAECEARTHFERATDLFARAADVLAHDDERRAVHRYNALACAFDARATLGTTLPLAARLREAAQDADMRRIWAHSALARRGRDWKIGRALTWTAEMQRLIDRQEIGEEEVRAMDRMLEL